MPRACMIIYALRRRVVPPTGGRRSTFKSSGPAWTHKVHWYVGLITVACMLTQWQRETVMFHCFRCSCGQDVSASLRNQSRWRNTNQISRHETVHPRLILTRWRVLIVIPGGFSCKIDRYLLMGVRVSVWSLKTRWCVNARHVNRSQNQKKF